MSELKADIELDTRGLRCPEPVMMLHRQIRKMAVGDIVNVIATDPATARDIPNFCEFLPHELIATNVVNGEYLYWVKKGQR
jgi:tRNA 2-thiouridine synthesizing protein A